jgi:hypothetical protein
MYPAAGSGHREQCMLIDLLGNAMAMGTYAEKFNRLQETGGEEQGTFTLDVQNLAPGLYFIHISSDTEKIILPVIVER